MDNSNPNNNSQSDELDLNEFVLFIKRGLNNIFELILKTFVYFKKNIIKFGIAAVAGLVIGIGLNTIVSKKLKTEVIVKPNLDSRDYLYDVIEEINANIKAKNASFFQPMGIDVENMEGFEVTVSPIDKQNIKNTKEDIQYLQALEKFKNDSYILDAVKNEVSTKSSWTQRISFYYKNSEVGNIYARRLMEYINSNDYYKELANIYVENARQRIVTDENLVRQIDELVSNYSQKLTQGNISSENRIVLDAEESLDITGMLNLKNILIKDIENQKVEIQNHKEAIRVISFGQSQEVQKSFFGKSPVLIPLVLLTILFIIDLLKYFNRRAQELGMQ